MRPLTTTKVWIWLAAVFCLLLAVLLGLSPSRHIKITAHLAAADIRQIRSVVRQENLAKWRSPILGWAPVAIQEGFANITRPIKLIKDTTNTLHELDKRTLSSLAAEATTNPAVKAQLREMEKRIRTQGDGGTNPAVEAWCADRRARWGEAGYILEKGTNGWKITVELMR